MRLIADTHTHTIASTHAYGTVIEMARGAAEKGLPVLGMTDHAPSMPDSPDLWHFGNLHQLPPVIEGVRVLRGCELNLMDCTGKVDLDEHFLQKMEWVVCSMHPEVIAPGSVEENTEAVLNLLKNPYVDVFGHPGANCYRFDYERVVPLFKDSGKYIEFNASSVTFREGAAENMFIIAKLCKEHRVEVIVNTDAHSPFRVGEFEKATDILAAADFPEELIVNADLGRFEKALANRRVPVSL